MDDARTTPDADVLTSGTGRPRPDPGATADPAGPPVRWRPALAEAALIWLVSRVAFQGIAAITVAVNGPAKHGRPGFTGQLFNWDSGWFFYVAQHGYDPQTCTTSLCQGAPSFFPGYPLATRAVAWLLGGADLGSAAVVHALWLVALVASFGAAWAMYRLTVDRFGTVAARWATAGLVLGPYGVFLAASYSEGLFLAFAIAAWWAAQRRWYLLAGVLAAGAGFTRVNGVFLVVALLVLVLQQAGPAWGPRIRGLLGVVVGAVGPLAALGLIAHRVGRLDAWLWSEKIHFGRQTKPPWSSLISQLRVIQIQPKADLRIQEIFELIAAVVLLVGLIAFLRRREWAAGVYTLLTMVSLMTSTSYFSLARGAITVFPIAVLAGAVASRTRHRTVLWTGVAVVLAVAVFNAVQFSLGNWAD